MAISALRAAFTLLFLSLPVWAVNLDQAVQSTLEKNALVGQSRSQVQQAEEAVDQIRGNILPNLSLNATYLRQPRLSDPVAAGFFPEEQMTTNLTLTQPIFRGLREFSALDRQKELRTAQKQTHLVQMMDLYQQTAQSYLAVLALEQDLRNLQAQQKIYKERVRDLQGRARRGQSSSAEALQAQSTAAALDAEYQLQSSRLRSARENFVLLTGLPAGTKLTDLPENEINGKVKPLEDYLSRIENRPDLKASKSVAEAADEDVSIAKGAHWPTVDLTGNYYFTRPEGFSEDLDWDIQIRATLPLFEGGVAQSKVRMAVLQRSEKDLAMTQARRKAEAEIRSLHDALRTRVDQLKALKLASDLAEKNYKLLQRDSRRGLARSLDVQLGLTEYRLAKRNYDQARYQARLDHIRLDLASAQIPAVLNKEM
ncbi:MAG: TolC family protein [Pseudobdellovibrio sp.]|nr:TolC family protein [Pseudobdellovibrio sp.]